MKLLKNKIYWLFIIVFMNSCIEEYVPNIESSDSKKYVVSGILTDQEGYQEININYSSSVGNPQLIQVKDCQVEITDSNQNSISLDEYKSGIYRAWISQDFLNIGMTYQLKITTPDGTNIISDPEGLMECPNVDSVYFNREDIPPVNIQGIQFYLDLNATNINTKHFKVDIEETWEYHALYPLQWYYDGTIHYVEPFDYSNMVCWKTEQIKDIFILNTSNLEVNKYKKLPLQYVDNKASRLAYGYSILLKQYSLNEKCFTYWDQLRINNLSDASLYKTQAFPNQGNLYNLTDPEITILGYFQVSDVKTKRLFIHDVENLVIDDIGDIHCDSVVNRLNAREYGPDDYPIYLLRPVVELNETCILYTTRGGTTKNLNFGQINMKKLC